jgi:hypothetical protein
MPMKRAEFLQVLRNPAWIAFIWFGMTAGISLLATPVRFSVTALTRPVALDVSRAVFEALGQAEFVALIVLLIVVRICGRAKDYWAACGLLALILIAQSAWLLPVLSERTEQIISGIEPAASYAHAAFSIMGISKLLILVFVGVKSLRVVSLNAASNG